jgi:hypothetical protein
VAYVGFVNPQLIGVAVERSDSTGDWATGVVSVTRVGSAVEHSQLAARVETKRDTIGFRLRRLPAARDSSRRWMVCYDVGRERPITFHRALAELPRARWEPTSTTWESAFVAADSIDATHAGRRWRRNPPPLVPFVVRDVCPGEGCEFTEWLACVTYRAYAADSTSALVVFNLERDELFTALGGDLHVQSAGMVVFRDTVRANDGSSTRVFTPADTLFPLYYEGEGEIRWFLHGRAQTGDLFFPNGDDSVSSDGKIVRVRPYRADWWVRVRNQKGQEGWLGPDGPPGGIVGIAPHYEQHPLTCSPDPDR